MAEGREAGQAQIELLASIPVLMLAGLIAAQLLLVGWAQSLADGAAEAGALAVADGRPPEEVARAALPGWSRERSEIAVTEAGTVTVRLEPPALLPVLGGRLDVLSRAWAGSGKG